MAFRLDRAPLVDFCNQTQPASTRHRLPDSRLAVERTCARALRRRPRLDEAACSSRRARPKPRSTKGATTRERVAPSLRLPAPGPLREDPFRDPCRSRGPGSAVLGRPQDLRPRRYARGDPEPTGPSSLRGHEVNRTQGLDVLTDTSRGFTGQGLACLAASSISCAMRRGFPRSVIRAQPPVRMARARSPLRATGRRHYPNPIRSDTSRREIAAPPAGDSGAARCGSRQGAAPSTIPPRQPHPREGRSSRARTRLSCQASPRAHLNAYHACAWARRTTR